MPEIAKLEVGIYGNLAPFQQKLAQLPAMFAQVQQQALAAGTSMNAALTAQSSTGAAGFQGLGARMAAETGSALASVKSFGSQATAAVSDFARSAQQSLQSLGSNLKSLGGDLTRYISAPLVALGAIAINKAGEVEQSMAVVAASLHLPADTMKQVSDLAIRLGADITLPNTSALDATRGFQALAQGGLSVKDSMDALRPTLQMAAVGQISVKDAAEDVAVALTAYHLAGTQAAHVTDIFTGATLNSRTSVNEFTNGLANAAPIATQLGHNIDDVSTALILSVRAGMQAAEAGTAYRTMMMRLAAPTEHATRVMKEFGMNFRDAEGNMKSIPGIIAELTRTLGPNATMLRAVGGSTEEMNKKLKAAETTFKSAQKVLADMPTTLASQSAHLAEMRNSLANVDDPARKLALTITHQRNEIGLATAEMIKHNREGLHKLGEENLLAKDRVIELTESMGSQKEQLAHLRVDMQKAMQDVGVSPEQVARAKALHTQLANAGTDAQRKAIAEQIDLINPAVSKVLDLQKQIAGLERSNRSLSVSIKDANATIAENARQMTQGLDATRERKEQIEGMSNSVKENEKKLDDWNKTERALKVSDLNAQINELTQKMTDNTAKLREAQGAQAALNAARENARLITLKMTQADKDATMQTLFGARGIKEASILMASGVDGFKKMEAQMIQNNRTAQIATAMNNTWKGKVDALKSSLEGLAIALGQKLLPQATAFVVLITDLVPKMQAFIDHLTKGNPQLLQTALRFAAFATAIGPALLALGTVAAIVARIGMLFTPLGLAITAVTAIVAGLAYAWTHNLGGIQEKTREFITNVKAGFTAFVGWLSPYLTAAWNGILAFAKPIWTEISYFLKSIWDPIKDIITFVWTQISTFLKYVWGQLTALFRGTWGNLVGFFSGLWQAIQGIVKVAWGLIAGIITVALDLLSGRWKKAWDDIKHYAKVVWDGIVDLLSGVLKAIGNLLLAAVKVIWNAGAALIQGFIDGFKSGFMLVFDAVKGLGTGIINTLKTLLGIKSPSTVFHEAGVNTAQGFIDGLNSMQGGVSDTFGQVFDVQEQIARQTAAMKVAIAHDQMRQFIGGAVSSDLAMFLGGRDRYDDAGSAAMQKAILAGSVAIPGYGAHTGSGSAAGAPAGAASASGGGSSAPTIRDVNVTQNIYGDVNNEADENRLKTKIAKDLMRTLRFASG